MSTATRNSNGAANRIKPLLAETVTVEKTERITVSAPKIRILPIKITGTAPYLQCRFSQKAMDAMISKQAAGDQTGKRAKRTAKNFDEAYVGSMHKDKEGRIGIPAGAFRAAMISACRLIGFKMTIAKLSVFVIADTYDAVDDMPLVFIDGKPEKHQMVGRNATGVCDIRTRAIFRKWSAVVRVKFDSDQFSASDVFNLMSRVGEQVGIGEGRPDSRESAGLGFGTFSVEPINIK